MIHLWLCWYLLAWLDCECCDVTLELLYRERRHYDMIHEIRFVKVQIWQTHCDISMNTYQNWVKLWHGLYRYYMNGFILSLRPFRYSRKGEVTEKQWEYRPYIAKMNKVLLWYQFTKCADTNHSVNQYECADHFGYIVSWCCCLCGAYWLWTEMSKNAHVKRLRRVCATNWVITGVNLIFQPSYS